MPRFLALTSRGLEPAVHEELLELGFKNLKVVSLGVEFESNWEGCYRANFWLRSATRVVLPILDFPAYQADDLYHNLKKHDFTKYIRPDQTLAVDGKTRLSNVFRDQRFLALKTKDAIVDQFRDKFGVRPNVDTKNPDLRVMVRVVKTDVSVAIDTSGESLAHRGYRKVSVMAPVREHMAAGLLRLADWKTDTAIVDPMCGSGTFLIEAALRAMGRPPGGRRTEYGFMKMLGFQPEAWAKVRAEGLKARGAQVRLLGFDRDPSAIRAAQENARQAGVESLVSFKVMDVKALKRQGPTGLVITNPPYAERIGLVEKMRETYGELAQTLKREFVGWDCWLLSGNEELTQGLKLKAERKIRVFNGTLDCRLLHYPIR
ncbi:MAG: class I SAM-dependent RNA methyltransferase [Bdellovibrionales bacterium]